MDASWSLGNADLLQNIATLVWINQKDSQMLEKVTAARIGYELYQRMSGERDVDALRNQTIAAIAKFVKNNPKASREELQKEIARQIFAFAARLDKV